MKTLDLAQNGLKAISRIFPKLSASETSVSVPEAVEQATDIDVDPLESSEEHFRQRSTYEDRREVQALRDLISHSDLRSVILEKLKVPFQRFLIFEKPLYPGFDADAQPGMDRIREFDQINAVWYSLLAAEGIDTRNAETYTKIYLAMTSNMDEKPDSEFTCNRDQRRHPVNGAKGLRTFHITLGIIYKDAPSIVVWPLGKSFTENARTVIVYCCADYGPSFS